MILSVLKRCLLALSQACFSILRDQRYLCLCLLVILGGEQPCSGEQSLTKGFMNRSAPRTAKPVPHTYFTTVVYAWKLPFEFSINRTSDCIMYEIIMPISQVEQLRPSNTTCPGLFGKPGTKAGVTSGQGAAPCSPKCRCTDGAYSRSPPGIFCFSLPQTCWDVCAQEGDVGERWLIRYALYKQYLKSGQYEQILCIIHAIVFVIREMPFHGWVSFFPSSSLSQGWRKQ